ncbi:AsmA family protein [Rheinheimera sp.]|uniref:AsmA family protein n=1 Tax=Rheinheimera sp. TaxID=1869214 RepID=UPI0027BA7CF6|nr:AsmA family protein [Rheinheimera sp.]
MKILKWFLLSLLAFTLLLGLYLTFWFDLNDVKNNLINKVAAETGRTLEIKQEIGWSLYPDLALTLAEVSLSQPQGLPGPAMLQVTKAEAAVALWPLLQQQIQLKKLRLDGVEIFITEQGKLNSLSGLTHNTTSDKTESSKSGTAASNNPYLNQLQLDELELSNVLLSQQKAGKTNQINLQHFSLQQFQPGKAAPVSFHFNMPDLLDIKGEALLLWLQNQQQLQLQQLQLTAELPGQNIQLQSALQLDMAQQQLQWQIEELQLKNNDGNSGNSKGSGTVALNYSGKKPAATVQLTLDQWQLQTAENNSSEHNNNPKTTQPDLSFLQQLDLQLNLQIQNLQLNKLQLNNNRLQLQNQGGLVQLTKASAELYQGNITAQGSLDARKTMTSYQLSSAASGLDILQLLKAAADMNLLSGTAELNFNAKGQGLLPDDLKTALVAQGQFKVTDGAINGINIPAQIRSARAALKNETAPDTAEAKKTDFSSLTGSFVLANAVLENHDLQLAAPLLRLSGSGNANLQTEQLDYQLKTALVNSLKGQGGKEKDELANIEIPLKISGTFAKPKYQLDTKALFNQHLKHKVDEQKDKLKNKLLEKLGGG